MLEDCDNTVSIYEGPAVMFYVENIQLECVEYGGMGKVKGPGHFIELWNVQSADIIPTEDPQFDEIEDEFIDRVMRAHYAW